MSRREFLAFSGAVTGAGIAVGVAALVPGGSSIPVVEPVPGPAATTTPATGPSSARAPAATLERAAGPTAAPPLPGSDLPVICKEAWGARPTAGTLVTHTIDRLTVHHTAVRLDRNRDAPARARGHQAYHLDAGWPDLAYHYLVDANGHVYAGRPITARGDTFTSYDPTGHLLVCCEGNFDEQGLPAAQFEALAALLAWAAERFDVAPATIAGHRDYASTTCPGAGLASAITDGTLRARVEQRMAQGGVTIAEVCGVEGADLVAVIEAGDDAAYDPTPPGFHLRYDNGPGGADASFPFGDGDWLPVAGHTGR